eukprot:1150705-Pelagomonas_calceolata.AAC.5
MEWPHAHKAPSTAAQAMSCITISAVPLRLTASSGASSCCGWGRLLPPRVDLVLFFMFLHGCNFFDV